MDISILKAGDIIQRKWPYKKGDYFYTAKIIEMTKFPTSRKISEKEKKNLKYLTPPSDIETNAVTELLNVICDLKKQLENKGVKL